MIYILFGTCFFISIVIMLSGINLRNEDFNSKKLLNWMLISAALVVIIYGVAVLSINEKVSYITNSIFFASATWLSVNLLLFFCGYSGDFKFINKLKPLFAILTSLDSIFVYSNVFTHKIFTLTYCDMILGPPAYIVNRLPLYYVHLIYAYFIVAITFILILVKLIKTRGIYRTGYLFLFYAYSVLIIVDVSLRLLDVFFDYTVICYGLMGMFVSTLVIKHVPRTIEKNIKDMIISNTNDSVFGFDNSGRLIYMNDQAKQLMKYYNVKDINEYYKSVYINRNLEFEDDVSWDESFKKYGKTRHYLSNYKKMYDNKDSYIGDYLIIHDNTLEVDKNEKEKLAVSFDKLTGIYNKSIFEIKVDNILKEVKEDYYMICVDVKNFKLINEFYGSSTGDQLLISLANVMKKEFDGNNLVTYCRLQGDRFALCMPKYIYDNSNLYNKLSTVNKLVDNLNIYLYLGIYPINDKKENVASMIEHATIAASLSKHDVNNHIKFYDNTIKETIYEENRTISAFQGAIKNKEFVLYIQPQISKDEEVLGGEALVRWIRDGQVVPPKDFIPLFEKSGLICELDKYVWELACMQLRDWANKGIDYYLSINLSSLDFFGMNIYKVLTGLVKKYNIDCKKLKLEITESVFVSNVDELSNLIYKLKSYGFVIEMDDFGSGYSSLNMLKSIDIDTIKMDMGFLYEEGKSNKSRLILEALIQLSKKLNLEVITEGVETIDQVSYLKEVGCDIFQGYYFGKPMSVNNFEKIYMEVGNDK